jgi:signal transduction histidine kinase
MRMKFCRRLPPQIEHPQGRRRDANPPSSARGEWYRDFELISVDDEVVAEVQPDLFAEALSNLIDNAIRYTPTGGRVSVEIQSAPVRVLVSDSGPGITLEDRERVFERFVRGRLAQGEGSGLGLAIVRDIAALHHATVEITDGPWGGLTFAIAFGGDAATPSDRLQRFSGKVRSKPETPGTA